MPRTPKLAVRRRDLEAALKTVQKTQTAFWDALSQLESMLLNVELDSTDDFTTCYDVESLLKMEEEN